MVFADDPRTVVFVDQCCLVGLPKASHGRKAMPGLLDSFAREDTASGSLQPLTNQPLSGMACNVKRVAGPVTPSRHCPRENLTK